MPNTPFMNMTLPAVGTTPGGYSGTSWGPLLTQSLQQVDAHDHSPGKGAPLTFTSGSFQVATDLGFGAHSLYSIQNILASGTITAQAFSGSLTQIRSGSFSSGSWTGGVAYSGSFVPGGNFTYSTSSLAAFVGVGGIQVATNSLGQVLISASIGDDKYASYLLAVPDAENPNFRQITGSGNVSTVDGGPGAFMTISGAVGADRYASYITLGPTANDPNARTLGLSGSGFSFVDSGPGGTLTLKDYDAWNDTGNGLYTTSSVTVIGPGGFTGSLTRTNTGNPYMTGLGGVSISTNSLGQVIISGSVPTITDLTGSGATAVSASGGIWTVSSSVPTATQIQFIPLTASNWNPAPTTVGQALVQLASPNFTASLAPPQSGSAVVSVSGSIAKAKSGVISLSGMLTVNPSLLASGTAQLYRDATAIGPTMSLLMSLQVPQAFSLNWIDTLPDVSIHTYSMQVSASVGTLTVLSGSGALNVREIN